MAGLLGGGSKKAAAKAKEQSENEAEEREFQKSEREHDAEVTSEMLPVPTQRQPRYSRDGVLENPHECTVGADGVAVGRVM